jgi:DNA polymerase-3 subunit delta
MNSIQSLDKEIAGNRLQSVYCFLGEEEYLKDGYIRKIAKAYLGGQEEHGLEIVYGSETDAKEIIDRAQSLGLFAEKRVLVLKESDALSSKNRKQLLEYLKSPSEGTCHILTSFKLDRKSSFYKEMEASLPVYCFDQLKAEALVAWVAARAKELGYKITLPAVQVLTEISGQSLGLLEQELMKIASFLDSQGRKEITEGDVKILAGSTNEVGGFELAESLARKELKQSLRLYGKMLLLGEDPVRMLASINYKFNVIWRVYLLQQEGTAPEEMARRLRMSPYMIRPSLTLASKRNLSQYLRSFGWLYHAEHRLKSGRGDPKSIMQRLIYKLAL